MIGLGHIGITKQRAEIAEYLDTWFDAAEFVMTSSKPKEVSSILTILRPFGPIVWVLVAATIVLILTILLTNDAVYFHFIAWHGLFLSLNCYRGTRIHKK